MSENNSTERQEWLDDPETGALIIRVRRRLKSADAAIFQAARAGTTDDLRFAAGKREAIRETLKDILGKAQDDEA